MTEYAHQELGGTFGHVGVATAYEHRAPYPSEVFDVLVGLIADEPATVLDLGAGEGAIARPLATRVDRVDALDISAAMVEAGRERPGGDQPNLRWVEGAAETAELAGPYALVTAGASLHWMEWATTMPRLVKVMTQPAQLAVVEHGPRGVPWRDAITEVIRQHSRSQGYDTRFDIVDALRDRGLFEPGGSVETEPTPFRQAVTDYVEQFHSRASLAREHMSPEEAAAFDRAVEDVVRPYAVDGLLELPVVASIRWGRPLAP
ncbi:MAG TPA: class I SAM-dependent methyltransferase [Nocardioidaceae bacterium]|nr:class I SAM-dependent methyltransferase [Nocardioidaceae bacterium]